MENLKIEIDGTKLQAALKKQLEDVCSSSYDSPVRKVIQEALKEQEGAIKKLVDEIISTAIGTEEFKKQMSDMVIGKLIEVALKK